MSYELDVEALIESIDEVMQEIDEDSSLRNININKNRNESHDDIQLSLTKEYRHLTHKLDDKIHENKAIIFKVEKQEKHIYKLRYCITKKDRKIFDLKKKFEQKRKELEQKRNQYLLLQQDYNKLQAKADIPEDERLVFDNKTRYENEANDENQNQFLYTRMEEILSSEENNNEDDDFTAANFAQLLTQNNQQRNNNKPQDTNYESDDVDTNLMMINANDLERYSKHVKKKKRNHIPQRMHMEYRRFDDDAEKNESDLMVVNEEYDPNELEIMESETEIELQNDLRYNTKRVKKKKRNHITQIMEYREIDHVEFESFNKDRNGTKVKKHKRRKQSEFVLLENENKRKKKEEFETANSNSFHNSNCRKWTKKEEVALIKGVKKYRKKCNNVFEKLYTKKKYNKIFVENNRSIAMMREKWEKLNREHKWTEKWKHEKIEKRLKRKKKKKNIKSIIIK